MQQKLKNKQMIKYDNFFFPSDNLKDSKKFYSEVLGLPVKFDFGQQGMVAFKVGDEEPAIIIKDKNKFPNAKPSVWLEVENVRLLYPELMKKGVKFLSEPFKIHTGWVVEFTDPSENLLGITDYIND
jgi:predicted enzyme related to lactoylglutathione lyase